MESHIVKLIEWITSQGLDNSEWGIIHDNELPLHDLFGVEHCDIACRNFVWTCLDDDDDWNIPQTWALRLHDRDMAKYVYTIYPFTTHNN